MTQAMGDPFTDLPTLHGFLQEAETWQQARHPEFHPPLQLNKPGVPACFGQIGGLTIPMIMNTLWLN